MMITINAQRKPGHDVNRLLKPLLRKRHSSPLPQSLLRKVSPPNWSVPPPPAPPLPLPLPTNIKPEPSKQA